MLFRKRIFAGKPSLQPEPFCPYLSNESGYLSLRQKFGLTATSGRARQPRPTPRGGKTHY